MSEVAVRQVLNPVSGEVLSLDRPTDELARWIYECRGFEQQLRTVKTVIGEELNRRLDSNAKWTERAGDWEIKGESPAPKQTWDGHELLKALQALRDEGYITDSAIDQAVECVITYKPRHAGIVKLLKLGNTVAERILSLRKEVERERRAPSIRKVV